MYIQGIVILLIVKYCTVAFNQQNDATFNQSTSKINEWNSSALASKLKVKISIALYKLECYNYL